MWRPTQISGTRTDHAKAQVLVAEMSLTFREYLSNRRNRYSPTNVFVRDIIDDEEFAVVTSREELDAYLSRRNIAPTSRMYARAVWQSYLLAKKRRRRASVSDAAGHPETTAPDRAG